MIDKETALHVAKLARLKLTDDEAERFSGQLSSIMSAFQEIASLSAGTTDALATPTAMAQTLRADAVEARCSPEQILANAPERVGHLFKVPPAVG